MGPMSRNVGKELHYTLRHTPEERGSHLLRRGNRLSRIEQVYQWDSPLARE
jgi:hypothetical protein